MRTLSLLLINNGRAAFGAEQNFFCEQIMCPAGYEGAISLVFAGNNEQCAETMMLMLLMTMANCVRN